ncbi:hypothetical protein RHMOL_Rhmol04G0249700 [Rhododendron molle]|nr:hypothetical protein RHMOL_Rhmol05G0179600 [Rhododendron molle]KAI8560362.1 hypothetical protein RHMOL_Rhmol04G0249700 [Rhododendron molle]
MLRRGDLPAVETIISSQPPLVQQPWLNSHWSSSSSAHPRRTEGATEGQPWLQLPWVEMLWVRFCLPVLAGEDDPAATICARTVAQQQG